MEEIKKTIERLVELVREKEGAIAVFVDYNAEPGSVELFSEGRMNRLAALIGAGVMSDEDIKEYVLKGVEAAMIALKSREDRKNGKTGN